ncbi:DNA methyltransferase [Thermaerobacillus caldiproteolyticus]|uniref:Methyltransferase n=1 Tax=Thermaerobacillus caldiproteolyticus TaxID=247480 RepID=A0A7V9Z974_9BACL|nr:DNA methyltransferase [Anoxybacillus caldiproteolyticus]MBA2876285.1 site-specific DNA-methyltransferase (adenine-specific) [Anoxybacillus caldiproteolyticus]
MVAFLIHRENSQVEEITYTWRNKPKRWGHSFHPMCSYLAMFPPGMPRYFIEQFTEEGDVVLDPFSGRGTAPLEACIAGRIGIGVDLNPLAYLLTSAKLNPPSLEEALNRIEELREMYEKPDISDVPEEIFMLFDEDITLPQLVFIKNRFANWKHDLSNVDRFLLAALMGIMHGKHRKSGGTSYLSISMPNTFSMSPNYIKNFIEKHGLTKPRVDVFDQLINKVKKLYRNNRPTRQGYAYLANAKNFIELNNEHIVNRNVKMVFTSPPYLKVVNYGTFNWIRLWLLGEDIKMIDKNLKLDDNHTLDRYVDFMEQIIRQCEEVLVDTGVACFVIGDVASPRKEPLRLAEYVWEKLRDRTNMRLFGIVEDHLPSSDKVTRIWGKTQGNATKIDRILILYKGNRPNLRYSLDSPAILERFTF